MQHQFGVLPWKETQKDGVSFKQNLEMSLWLFIFKGELWEWSYLSHTLPLTLSCGSSPHCTEPAAAYPDPSLNHYLWSSRTPHPAGCSPLTHTHTHKRLTFELSDLWSVMPILQYDTHDTDAENGGGGGEGNDDEMMVIYIHLYKWWMVFALTGTHSSPAAACTPVCPWGIWSGPCCRQWSL